MQYFFLTIGSKKLYRPLPQVFVLFFFKAHSFRVSKGSQTFQAVTPKIIIFEVGDPAIFVRLDSADKSCEIS